MDYYGKSWHTFQGETPANNFHKTYHMDPRHLLLHVKSGSRKRDEDFTWFYIPVGPIPVQLRFAPSQQKQSLKRRLSHVQTWKRIRLKIFKCCWGRAMAVSGSSHLITLSRLSYFRGEDPTHASAGARLRCLNCGNPWSTLKHYDISWYLHIQINNIQCVSMHFNALLNQMLSSVCVFIQLWTEEQVRTPTLNSSKQPLACPAILMFKMAPTPTTLLQDATSPVLCENALPDFWQPRQLQSDSAVRLFRSHSGLEKRRFLWSEQASCSISYTFELWYLSKGHVNVVTGSFLCFCAKTLSNSCALPGRELAFLFEFDV